MSDELKRQQRPPVAASNPIRASVVLIFLVFVSCGPLLVREPLSIDGVSPQDFTRERQSLVDQLKAEGITNGDVLNALLKVPRHEFVPESHRHYSYQNRPLPIGHAQTISQPFIVGYMTQEASIARGEKVLEIGTGSGYQAAVLAELAEQVYTIEIIPELAEGAKSVLQKLGYGNVHVKAGNGYAGWPEHAPFDAIVVTAAPAKIPQALVDQLAVKGKMVLPVGTTFQEMVIITRDNSGVIEQRTIPVRFVPMTGKPDP